MPLYWSSHYYCTFKNVACAFQPSSCFLMWTLSWKPGEVLFTFRAIFTCNYSSLSTGLTKLLRFKLNQITGKKSERIRLTMLLLREILTRSTRKPWLKQAYHASEVGDFNQAYQETLVKPSLQWLYLVKNLNQIYQKTLENSNQAYQESLVISD